jgi:hypothetical protein
VCQQVDAKFGAWLWGCGLGLVCGVWVVVVWLGGSLVETISLYGISDRARWPLPVGGGFFGVSWCVVCSCLGGLHVGGLFIFGEFDPGSGRTLAACLTHASRTVKPFGVDQWRTGE